ncbi:ABC transporter ATP-binding protein, partial [Lacticaseibacillus rhamnosus]
NNVQYLKGAFANLAELERKFVMQSGNSPYPTKPTIQLHISNLRNFDHLVLKKVDMAIAPGQIIGLSGVSGSGKSTLAKAIVGLQHQYEGKIDYSKTPISKISASEMGANVAYVSVDQSLFHVSIEKNLQGFSANDATQNVWQRLEQLGVSKARLDYLRTTLSAQVGEDGANIDKLADGDRQLLLILRALLLEKDLIILDETLSSLDTARFAEVSRLLRHYVDTFKVKMILISHKTNRLHFADHVYGITKGECVYFSKLADWASTYEDEQNVKNS